MPVRLVFCNRLQKATILGLLSRLSSACSLRQVAITVLISACRRIVSLLLFRFLNVRVASLSLTANCVSLKALKPKPLRT